MEAGVSGLERTVTITLDPEEAQAIVAAIMTIDQDIRTETPPLRHLYRVLTSVRDGVEYDGRDE
ncbi:hypothetical protein SEA_SADLAD_61 [Microbacterium phage SadLad]|nr:hypothetical protein SEA_SADLAD_61 [Microbacterium phage SadLad]